MKNGGSFHSYVNVYQRVINGNHDEIGVTGPPCWKPEGRRAKVDSAPQFCMVFATEGLSHQPWMVNDG